MGKIDLIGRLKEMGCDMENTMNRFLDDESFYESCYRQLLTDDANFVALGAAIEKRDIKAVFECSHTLKGIIANMGLTPLLDKVCVIVEKVRGNVEFPSGLDEDYASFMETKKKFAALL